MLDTTLEPHNVCKCKCQIKRGECKMMGVLVSQKNSHRPRIAILPRPPTPHQFACRCPGEVLEVLKDVLVEVVHLDLLARRPLDDVRHLAATDVGGAWRATVGPSHTGAAGQVRPRSGNPTWSSYNKKIVSPQVPSPELFKSSTKLKFARPHLGGLRTFTFEGFFRSFEGSFEDQFSNNTLKLTANR